MRHIFISTSVRTLFSLFCLTILGLFFSGSIFVWVISGSQAHAAKSLPPHTLSSQTAPVLSPMPSLSSAYGGAFTETRDGVALIAAPNETFKETVVKEIEEASEDEAVSEEKVEAAPAPESPTFINPIPSARINQGLHGHNGIDLGAAVGTPIIASRGGTVKTSISGGWNGGYGSYIVISHADGTETLYAHLAANYVSSGVTVTQGQAIGEVGMTGRTTGPHLHYEVHGASNHLAY